MKKYLFLLFYLFSIKSSFSQKTDKELVGNYFIQGVREMGSGFQLNADNSFQFFLSYGALDRNGHGKWRKENDSLVFESDQKQIKDFKLDKSEKRKSKGIIIKITGPDTYLNEMVFVQINNGKNSPLTKADRDGMIYFEENYIENINLIFQFCPEKITKFEIPKGTNNYFEFSMLQSIFDINFNNLKLKISPNKMTGRLTFFDEKEYIFEKGK